MPAHICRRVCFGVPYEGEEVWMQEDLSKHFVTLIVLEIDQQPNCQIQLALLQ